MFHVARATLICFTLLLISLPAHSFPFAFFIRSAPSSLFHFFLSCFSQCYFFHPSTSSSVLLLPRSQLASPHLLTHVLIASHHHISSYCSRRSHTLAHSPHSALSAYLPSGQCGNGWKPGAWAPIVSYPLPKLALMMRDTIIFTQHVKHQPQRLSSPHVRAYKTQHLGTPCGIVCVCVLDLPTHHLLLFPSPRLYHPSPLCCHQ